MKKLSTTEGEASICVRVAPGTKDRIRTLAERRGTSQAEILRLAVRAFIDKRQHLLEAR